jgi:predicted small lipoprotein YifL
MLLASLGACGRRGALEPPPDETAAAAPPPTREGRILPGTQQAAPAPKPKPNRSFILDPLLD